MRAQALLLTLELVVLCTAGSAVAYSNFVVQDEEVPPDTLRIIALGTGTPNIARNQVATSFLVRLGGERDLLFDVGTGSLANLHAVVPQEARGAIDTVFISHLHSDHITDLAPLYAIPNNRQRPLTVFGPAGPEPKLGTRAMVAAVKQMLAWDQRSRNHVHDYPGSYRGNQIVAHEFDFSKENQLIYQQGDLSVYSNPAFHYDMPGPVSFRLEWKGLKVTYSGDTIPLNTFLSFAAGSDVVIHESVGPVLTLERESQANRNVLLNHTTQREVGAIFNALKPRLAIATHLRVNPYTVTPLVTAIRATYPSGPLTLANDFDVWDVSRTRVVQRQFVPASVHAGYEMGDKPEEHSLATEDVQAVPRPKRVRGGWSVFHVPSNDLSHLEPHLHHRTE